jgi:hypothetical protein
MSAFGYLRRLGFAASAAVRAAVALAFAVLVALAVWSVERTSAPVSVTASAAPVPPRAPAALCQAEATFAVGGWTVLADGIPVAGAVTPQRWEGIVAGAEVLVQADRADAADLSPGAVRVRWAGRELVVWAEGPVTAVVRP